MFGRIKVKDGTPNAEKGKWSANGMGEVFATASNP
jgi:hypothetical protein